MIVLSGWVTCVVYSVSRSIRIVHVGTLNKKSSPITQFCKGRNVVDRKPHFTSPNPQGGMTLIEVLIAVALMAMLSVGLFTSLQIGATSWSTTHDALMLDRRIASANALLRSLLVSIVPLDAKTPPSSELSSQKFLFFQGEPQSMRWNTGWIATHRTACSYWPTRIPSIVESI